MSMGNDTKMEIMTNDEPQYSVVEYMPQLPQSVNNLVAQAELLAEKTWRMLGIQKQELVGIYLKGHELGFKMTTSPQFIRKIQGKYVLSPEGHLALIHASGILKGGAFKVTDNRDDNGDPVSCTVYMRRGDSGAEYETTFTITDAKRAGIMKDGGAWFTYPANMLRWRAIGYCADVIASDIGGGMLRADEIGIDVAIDGSFVEMDTVPQITMNDLSAQYTNEEILEAMQATDGTIQGAAQWLENNQPDPRDMTIADIKPDAGHPMDYGDK